MLSTQVFSAFVALEPDEAARELIWRYKERVRELVGDQLYLDHPPHMTLYLAMFQDIGQVIDTLRQFAPGTPAPQLSIAGWHTFVADPLTGNNTLVFDLTAADRLRLREVQSRIVSSLSAHRDSQATLARINGRWGQLSQRERDAASRWGFPYVGGGWHPHFTVASILPADWPAIERELIKETPQGLISCNRLQVFQLVDDEPSLLESFDLAARDCAKSRNGHAGAKLPESKRPAEPHRGVLRDRSASPSRPKRSAPSQESTASNCESLKDDIVAAIWQVVDRHDWILSATITGSFLADETLDSISDIDLVAIVDELNGPRFNSLQTEFDAALRPVLAPRNLSLRINPTLGPLKFNDSATAVLHMMLYSREGHREHVIKSPFTCFDWQRSETFRKLSMASVYPVFGLQPHHFGGSRRGVRDYLSDFERGVVSYRELVCNESSCDEIRRDAPMSARDRYEFAYHVMRFLMQNLVKLMQHQNVAPDGDALLETYRGFFPKNFEIHKPLYLELRRRKKARDFSRPIPRLVDRLREFVLDFEAQFRSVFIETATRHILFRHAPTHLNGGQGDSRHFVGRLDPDIEPPADDCFAELVKALEDSPVTAVHTSPLRRCQQSLMRLHQHVPLPPALCDDRLVEIDYGRCDGLTVHEARRAWPDLFAAWSNGEDPRFPGGENATDVCRRVNEFAGDVWRKSHGNSIACTHNVVLRCLVGRALDVPRVEWHRIEVPHLAPITIIQTEQFGSFVDLEESVERRLLAPFARADEAHN